MRPFCALLPVTLLLSCAGLGQVRRMSLPGRIPLDKQWSIQSSASVPEGGGRISTAAFDATSWYAARVPSTVLAALVDHGVYPDPNFGMNLRSVPGTEYEIGDQFANLPMPADSPFAVSWWYRTTFRLPPGAAGRRFYLHFDSINYRANIWVNGRLIAGAETAAGMYRSFEFDITTAAGPGINALAVEVFAPGEDDLGLTFVDWNPLPADKDMGLVGAVFIRESGPVTVRNTQIVTRVEGSLDLAHLTVYADLKNDGADAVDGVLHVSTLGMDLVRPVHLAAGESATVALTARDFPQLDVRDPELWWPYGLGPQTLHDLRVDFIAGGAVSDAEEVRYGIREFTSELDARRNRLFRINGKRILIRGGGWTHDMLMRVDDEREEDELTYARDMHLNTVRLEGKMMTPHFFETADRLGLMVMPGWCCCGYWEQWPRWKPDDYTMAAESLRSQLRRLRNYAGVFVFLYGSDESPTAEAERVYLEVFREERWPHSYLSSATDRDTPGAGWTGVKMTGPYDYVAPGYWLEDTRRGGAFGFITETSPGFAIPVLESLREMLPAGHLWPVDDYWQFHAASPGYPDMQLYRSSLEARYGTVNGLDDFVAKSQLAAYEGERAMFEAYRRNKYVSTGVVQWMLNNAWPSTVWHLYDYYLRPGGGYFGTKKANEPLHVQYSYDDRSIAVANSLYRSFAGYTVTAKVYNLDLSERYSRSAIIDIPEDSSTRVFSLPALQELSRTYFVRLFLNDANGDLVSSNFYWLSTQPDVFDWNNSDNVHTAMTAYADLSGLEMLPPARLNVTWRSEEAGAERVEHVTVENSSSNLAVAVRLIVRRGNGGPDINPVLWEDNYFELFPGERRELTATYKRRLLETAQSFIEAVPQAGGR